MRTATSSGCASAAASTAASRRSNAPRAASSLGVSQRAAGPGVGVVAGADDRRAVDQDVVDAGRWLLGVGVGAAVGDGAGIEDDEVGERSVPYDAAVGEA